MTTIDDSNPIHNQWKTQITAADASVIPEEARAWINELQRVLDEMTQPTPDWAGSPQEAQLMAAAYILADVKATRSLGEPKDLAGKVGAWRTGFENLRNQLLGVDKASLPVSMRDLNQAGLTQALHGWVVATVETEGGHLPRTLEKFLNPDQRTSAILSKKTSPSGDATSTTMADFRKWVGTLNIGANEQKALEALVKKDPTSFASFKEVLGKIGGTYSDETKSKRVVGKLIKALVESQPQPSKLSEATTWLSAIASAIGDKSDVTLTGAQLELVIDNVMTTSSKDAKAEFESMLKIIKSLNAYPEKHEALLSGILLEVEQTLGVAARDRLIATYKDKTDGTIKMVQEAIKLLVNANPKRPDWINGLSASELDDVIRVQVSKLIIQVETGKDPEMSLIDVKDRLLMPAKSFIEYIFNHSGFKSPLLGLVKKWNESAQNQLASALARVWSLPSIKESLTLTLLKLFVLEDMQNFQEVRREEGRQEMELLRELERLDIEKMSQKELEEAFKLLEHIVKDPEGIVQARLIISDALRLESGFDKVAMVLDAHREIELRQVKEEDDKMSQETPTDIVVRLFGAVRGLSKSNAQAVMHLMDFEQSFDPESDEHWGLLTDVARLVGQGKLAEAKARVQDVYGE